MRVYRIMQKIGNGIHRIVVEPFIKNSFAECGRDVFIPKGCIFQGIENVFVGSSVHFGFNNIIFSTRAKVKIGNNVMFGPNIQIISGDHRMDLIGRSMISITDDEKLPENDLDVTICDDVWIGAGATILKGVTIGEGSIVAAGAIVTKDVLPYSVYGGGPAKLIRKRFREEELEIHLSKMHE